MSAKRDPRGQVAVVVAHSDGPAVHFVDSAHYAKPGEALIESLIRALAVWGRSNGEVYYSFPRAIWVQRRAGQWGAAL